MTLEVEINRTLARCVGAHPEEILERVTRNDMPNTSTDFDMLCTVLDDLPLILGGLPNGTSWSQRFFFYTVINPKTGQILVLIFRCTIKACYDDQARLKTLEKWMQPATPDEYDITSEKTPELCRPLQAAVGDRRKGAGSARSRRMHVLRSLNVSGTDTGSCAARDHCDAHGRALL